MMSSKDTDREYAEIWGETVSSNRHLRLLSMGLGGLTLLLAVVVVRLGFREMPRPIVVRVDEVGRAEALNYKAVEAKSDPLDSTTKYFLNRFIHDHYSRRAATVQEHWTRSLRFLTTDLANAAFQAENRNIALVAARAASEETKVENIVLRIHANRSPPHGATADFELVRIRQEKEVGREKWSLSLQFSYIDRIPPDLMIHNPMGIVVTYLQADRALVSE
jgi:type IV secretory pathway TrbF-like protein